MGFFGTASSDQTERAMAGQMLFAFGSLVVLVVFASSWPLSGRVVGWTVMTICCASLVGMLLGLLFGLPAQRVEVTRATSRDSTADGSYGGSLPVREPAGAVPSSTTEPTADGANNRGERQERSEVVSVPYSESTSLEQVADWLTKIIIGLTLTQYASWEQRFSQLSVDVTANLNGTQPLLGRCIARLTRAGQSVDQREAVVDACSRLSGGAVPGGLLMLTFAALGFLVTYLWMRRYFIIEMVVARNSAIDKMRVARDADIEKIRVARKTEEQNQLTLAMAAQLKSNVELDRARQEAVEAREQLDQTRRAMEDQTRVEFARTTQTLQLNESYGDRDYAITALTRAQLLLPSNDEAQSVCRDMINALGNEPPHYPDDPWRGLFGGHAQALADNVQLDAAVTALPSNANLFELVLTIKPIDSVVINNLSGQKAVFFLHPTFGRDPRAVSFGPDGQAVLRLISYGAFTVGALLENGHKLELNLAEIPDAPELFRVA